MDEKTVQSVKKTLVFEEGETLSIEIILENVSPVTKAEAIKGMLDSLYRSTIVAIF